MNNNNSVVQPRGQGRGVDGLKGKMERSKGHGHPMKAGPGGGGALPSFNDILWCTDVDGDVMTSSAMDVNMVRCQNGGKIQKSCKQKVVSFRIRAA